MRVLRSVVAFVVLSSPHASAGAANPVLQMVEATCKLANKDSAATCVLLTRPVPDKPAEQETLLVTANHVLQQMTGEEGVLVLRKGRDDGQFARVELKLKVRQGDKPLWTKHPEVDVAAMRVPLPVGMAIVPLPLDALATEEWLRGGQVPVGGDLNVAGYPIRLEANGAGFPIVRKGCLASHPIVPVKPHRTFLVDYNSFAGDSGGPVFAIDAKSDKPRPVILGLVLGQHLHDERIKLVYEERVTHHRLGLGIVIQAEFVRQTVDAVK